MVQFNPITKNKNMKSTFLSLLAIISLVGLAHAHCGSCGTGDEKKDESKCDKKDCDWSAKFKAADTDANGSLSLKEFLAMAESKKSSCSK